MTQARIEGLETCFARLSQKADAALATQIVQFGIAGWSDPTLDLGVALGVVFTG